MKSRIELAKLTKTLITKVVNFLRFTQFRQATIFFKCASHSHHNFTVLFFYNQVGINFWHNFVKGFSSKLNVKNSFVKFTSSISSFMLAIISTVEGLGNPVHDVFVGIANFYICVVVASNIAGSRFGVKYSNEEATLPINKSSKICEIGFRIHNYPCLRLVYHKLIEVFMSTLNDLAGRTRKSMRKSELHGNMQRDTRRGSPPACKYYLHVGHKSNRLPVLNSAAARLGQSLRETQDVLVRDQLEATASIINCVGKQHAAHVKSSLMDLKLFAMAA